MLRSRITFLAVFASLLCSTIAMPARAEEAAEGGHESENHLALFGGLTRGEG
jgi:hypothetical protein